MKSDTFGIATQVDNKISHLVQIKVKGQKGK